MTGHGGQEEHYSVVRSRSKQVSVAGPRHGRRPLVEGRGISRAHQKVSNLH